MQSPPALSAFESGNLASIREALFALLGDGAQSRHSPLHTLSMATAGLDGMPGARTVVLRGFDEAARLVRIHSDARSSKIGELRKNPRSTLLWYAAEWKLQIRIPARIAIHHGDSVARQFWDGMSPHSRRIYSAPFPPGTPSETPLTDIAPHLAGAHATEANTAAGFEVFTVLLATFEEIEWLTLSATGNRRGHLRWQAEQWQSTWLAP